MAWNYRKRITIAPGVRLNLSKKGVSTTFGIRGANINIGKNGTFLNTGIPGTGLYRRQKIGGGKDSINPTSNISNPKSNNVSTIEGCFISLGILLIIGLFIYDVIIGLVALAIFCFIMAIIKLSTSKPKNVETSIQSHIEIAKKTLNQATNPIQKEILQNFISCAELSRKASETEAIIYALKQKIERRSNSLLKEQLEKHETQLTNIVAELNKIQLDADKDLDDVEKWQYSVLCENFSNILSSQKIWLITSSVSNTDSNSSASTTVERKEINFDTGFFNYIKSSFDIPIFRDLSGNTYYIYPRYIIKAQSFTSFEVSPIDTINIKYSNQRFIEDDILPEDSHTVDYTYQYVNKNGEPDKRYSFNPRLPIVEYGKIEIEDFGLTYHISNNFSAEEFVNIYNLWQNKSSNNINPLIQLKNITEEYFNQVNEATEKLMLFYNQLKNNKEFLTLVKKHLNQTDKTVKDSDLLYMLFCLDIKTCYDKLQIPINFSTKEGLGFFIFSKLALGFGNVQYDQLENLQNLSGNVNEGVLNLIKLVNLKGEIQHEFLIADLLFISDSDMMKQYIILMYRFVSIVAKADGTISEIEQKWLSELLKLSDITDKMPLLDKEKVSNDFPDEVLSLQDPLFKEAARIVVNSGKGSASLLQRKLKLGYNRAGQIIDQLETAGIIGAFDGANPRKVLINDEYELELLLNNLSSKHTKKTIKQQKEKSERYYPKLNSNSQTELRSLIGLDSVKTEIETLTNFIKIQQERQLKGLKTSQLSYHCIFTGNPGTGKTTVARIVAEIYKELGILKKGHLVETDRSGLVAEYVGQTAVKTNKIIDTALDGVLFIDEAYSLISNSENDYGKEAIATLLKRMEDNRDRLVVILAGYSNEMQQFINSNPGLQSRFNRYIEFPDYSAEELYQIFELNLKQFDYKFAEDVKNPLKIFLEQTIKNKDKNFGNARFIRNLFEKTIERQANRLSKEFNLTNEKLSEICFEDIPCK